MSDAFDQFFAASLAPDDRLPDRAFVRRVQVEIMMEAQLAAARKHLLQRLAEQVLALGALTISIVLIARSDFVSGLASLNSDAALAIVLTVFAGIALVIGRVSEDPEVRASSVNGS